MSETLEKTQALLEKHHRDGERFAQLMKETADGRFDADFWAAWDRWIAPVLTGATPTVLDLGTGPGTFLHRVTARHPGVRALGVECAPYMLAAMGALPAGSEILREDLHDPHLSLPDGAVDAALASVVLHEMHQPVKALRETCRALRPGGRFYVLDWVRAPLALYLEEREAEVFDPATGTDVLEDIFTHFVEHNRFTREDLAYLLEHTGFRVLENTPLKGGRFARIIAEKV